MLCKLTCNCTELNKAVSRKPDFLQAIEELDWKPEFSLVEGLQDSYSKDFGRGTFRKEADFTTDDQILEKVKSKEAVLA